MNACTLFSHVTDLKLVYDRLVRLYGSSAVSLKGSPENFSQITVTTRKFFRNSTLTINVLRLTDEGNTLAEMTYKMQHAFQAVQTAAVEIQEKLLVKIGTIRLGLGIVAERRINVWDEAIFALAKDLDGIIFWDGKQMLNAKGHIILEFSGKSRVSELEVKVDADFVLKEVKHSEAAKARKVQNETLLAEYEVPTNRNLPPIVDAQNAHLRSKTAVADRALALCLVALQGEGLDQAILNQVQAQFEISGHLSPKEQAFLQNPDQLERATFAWRYEALNVMMWALGYVEVLAYPDRICDVQQIVGIIRNANSREGFQAGAKLRTIDELLDQADLAFRLHWACVDAGLREVQPSADLNCGVVYQRLYALNWLHGDQGSDWDDVHTGTYAK